MPILVVVFELGLLAASARAEEHTFAITVGGSAVLTHVDIVEYRFAEHAVKIRGVAASRLAQLRPSLSGTPFHVEVDGERVYSGRFVSAVSSMSFKEPTILLSADTNEPASTIVIRGPFHHEPRFQTGADPRIDVRITRALSALGKLTAGFAGGANDNEALTRRVAEILAECQGLKLGTTRAEFSKTFEMEGGVRTAARGVYAHRHCRYIKLDAEFVAPNSAERPMEALPSDVLGHVSKPYLAWNIVD